MQDVLTLATQVNEAQELARRWHCLTEPFNAPRTKTAQSGSRRNDWRQASMWLALGNALGTEGTIFADRGQA